MIIDITAIREAKIAAARCYEAQFDRTGMNELVLVLDLKSCQVAAGKSCKHGEPLKILRPSVLRCGL